MSKIAFYISIFFMFGFNVNAIDNPDSYTIIGQEDAKQLLAQIAENESMTAEDKKFVIYRNGFPPTWKTVSETKETEINKSLLSFETDNKRGIYVMFGHSFHYTGDQTTDSNIKLYIEKTKEAFKEAIKEKNVTVIYVLRIARYKGNVADYKDKQTSQENHKKNQIKSFHFVDVVLASNLEKSCKDEIMKTVKANFSSYSFGKDGNQAITKYSEITKEKVKGCEERKFSTNPKVNEGLISMQNFADASLPYKYGGGDGKNRTDDNKEALATMDCSEFVGRYLYKIGVFDEPTDVISSNFSNPKTANTSFKDKIEFLEGSNKSDFIDIQPGDFFVLSGHMGLVKSFDSETDVVTVLEAIGSSGSREEELNEGLCVNCVRESKYTRTGDVLAGRNPNSDWIGYYRPITTK